MDGLACALKAVYEYRDAVSAVATVFIALFTFTLWRSTKRLWESTDKTVGLAQQEFNAAHRPWLAIANFKITKLSISGGAKPPNSHALWLDGTYTIANSGSSPALYTVNWQTAENRAITEADADNLMSGLCINTARKQGKAVPPNNGIEEEFTSRIEIVAPPIGTKNTLTLCLVVGIAYQGATSDETFETVESFGIFQRQAPGMATPAALDFVLISGGTMPDLIYRRAFNISRMT
jgi:hypothetical protein